MGTEWGLRGGAPRLSQDLPDVKESLTQSYGEKKKGGSSENN